MRLYVSISIALIVNVLISCSQTKNIEYKKSLTLIKRDNIFVSKSKSNVVHISANSYKTEDLQLMFSSGKVENNGLSSRKVHSINECDTIGLFKLYHIQTGKLLAWRKCFIVEGDLVFSNKKFKEKNYNNKKGNIIPYNNKNKIYRNKQNVFEIRLENYKLNKLSFEVVNGEINFINKTVFEIVPYKQFKSLRILIKYNDKLLKDYKYIVHE